MVMDVDGTIVDDSTTRISDHMESVRLFIEQQNTQPTEEDDNGDAETVDNPDSDPDYDEAKSFEKFDEDAHIAETHAFFRGCLMRRHVFRCMVVENCPLQS